MLQCVSSCSFGRMITRTLVPAQPYWRTDWGFLCYNVAQDTTPAFVCGWVGVDSCGFMFQHFFSPSSRQL